MERHVILGAGAAGLRAAEVLRERRPDDRITLISAEATPFVERHRLAGYVVDKTALAELIVHPPQWYQERRLELRLNQPVVQVRPSDHTVLLAHRERLRYDQLLLCVGARHRVPPYLARFEELLTPFSTTADAIRLRARLPELRHLTLIGGDCVGLQLVSALLPAGKAITLVMDEYRFWPFEFNDPAKDRLSDAIVKKGVEVIRDDYVTSLVRQDHRIEVQTKSGRRFATDAAMLTAGLSPFLQFLLDSGIDLQEGVLVNDHLESSTPGIWAAGECAQVYHPELRDYRCSTGYVNARIQGELAARNMTGARETVALGPPGQVTVSGETFTTLGWKGFSCDETN
jgi:NAD(P)H-nitrite reductase large subunit